VDQASAKRQESFFRRVRVVLIFPFRYLTSIYSAIRFTVNLYEHHNVSLTQAYAHAVAQFRSLRSEHQIATTFAALEAEAHGSAFGPSEISRGFVQETKSIPSWERRAELDEGAMAARKRWKAIVERKHSLGEWSKGQEYVRLWKEGVRPTYAPPLTEPMVTPAGLREKEVVESEADFMDIR
jgi:small subunit ribosomal protein S23